MFSFEGNYKSKRCLQLDQTHQLTTETILQKSRQERKEREDIRRKQNAATKIQSCLRGWIGRRCAKNIYLEQFRHSLTELNASLDDVDRDNIKFDKLNSIFTRLLQSFNSYFRNKPCEELVHTVSEVILSKNARYLIGRWLNGEEFVNSIQSLTNTLILFVNHLSDLRSQTSSSNFVLLTHVLEVILNTKDISNEFVYYSNLKYVIIRLSESHYFRKVAFFTDQQLFVTDGYVTINNDNNDSNKKTVFSLTEFLKPVRTQTFLNLILLPLQSACDVYQQTDKNNEQLLQENFKVYRKLFIMAINDILVQEPDDRFKIGERIIRAVGSKLLQFSNANQMIVEECMNSINLSLNRNSKSQNETYLVPCINLLHLLVTRIAPSFITDPKSASNCTDGNKSVSEYYTADHDDDDNDRISDEGMKMPDASMDLECSESDVCMLPVELNSSSTILSFIGTELQAVIILRCLCWLLMQSFKGSQLPIIQPMHDLKFPKRKETDKSYEIDDSDDDDVVDSEMLNKEGVSFGTNEQCVNSRFYSHERFCPSWSSELVEICAVLVLVLPPLALTALSTLNENQMDLNLSEDQWELVKSLAFLHYFVFHVCSVPTIIRIRLNSIYSEKMIYMRSLWILIESATNSTATDGSVAASKIISSDFGSTIDNSSLFSLLTTGELPVDLSVLQDYLPYLFTFANCLHHRLLCLTDSEIHGLINPNESMNTDSSNTPSNSSNTILSTTGNELGYCGFKSNELLFVGTKLRDLMLGLIDLAHPNQLPKKKEIPGVSEQNVLVETDKDRFNYRALLKRLEERAELVALGFNPDQYAQYGNTRWSAFELRIHLYCWTSLFRCVQRLVLQIYDWDRRCRRQALEINPIYFLNDNVYDGSSSSTNLNKTKVDQNLNKISHGNININNNTIIPNLIKLPVGDPTTSQTFWLKENYLDMINIDSQTWLQKHTPASFFASVAFGLYSVLNTDKNSGRSDSFILTNHEIRQVLLLKEVPFVIPFVKRVQFFQMLTRKKSLNNHLDGLYSMSSDHKQLLIVVRRSHLYEDAFEKLNKENEPNLRPQLRIKFLNQMGLEELGFGDGLTREFLTELIRTGFDPNRGFFVYAADKTIYPNPQAAAINPDYLKHFYFLGRILAKAIYEGILVELQFSYFFLAKIVSRSGEGVGFDYLHSLDPQMYKQLLFLKSYQGNISELALDFTIVESVFDQPHTIELKPNGKHILVTKRNCVEYIHLIANYKLNKVISPHVRAFSAGLNDVIGIDCLRLFDAEELQTLISGADMVIDVQDLKQHTSYLGSSAQYTETLNSFWSVLETFTETDKRQFLRFVTACSRPPMFGFRELQPPFTIQIIDEIERLPTASTCWNLLRLPDFREPELLKEKLLYALNANAGFEYS